MRYSRYNNEVYIEDKLILDTKDANGFEIFCIKRIEYYISQIQESRKEQNIKKTIDK